MWTISKIVFILSHGQSFTERRFSINHEVIDHKRKDPLHRTGLCLMQFIMVVLSYDFPITPALRKSCPLSYQRCKLGLEKNAEEKANNSADLKRKIKHDDTQKVKKQKIDLEATIKALWMVSSRRHCLLTITRICLRL